VLVLVITGLLRTARGFIFAFGFGGFAFVFGAASVFVATDALGFAFGVAAFCVVTGLVTDFGFAPPFGFAGAFGSTKIPDSIPLANRLLAQSLGRFAGEEGILGFPSGSTLTPPLGYLAFVLGFAEEFAATVGEALGFGSDNLEPRPLNLLYAFPPASPVPTIAAAVPS
jgi:hypothetical protein